MEFRNLTTLLARSKSLKWLLLFMILFGVAASPLHAQDSRKQEMVVYAGPRTSPFDPPKENDITFVTDSAPTLDTSCRFNSEGPITFEIRITRFVGPVNADGTLQNVDELISNNVISATATLLMPAYDVDYDAANNPERDRVSFNGHDLGFLTGANNVWKLNSFEIPVRFLKFPSRGANGVAPAPAVNTVRIDIDINNAGWCTAIDWGANRFKALSPIILIHGNNSNGGFFERQGFVGELQSRRMAYDNSINLPTAFISNNGMALNDSVNGIPGIVKSFGVDSVHLIVHSKGGLDTREYLANYQPSNDSVFKILSYTSLSTPHNGSAGADVLVARANAADYVGTLGRVEFVGFPGFTRQLAALMGVDDGTRNLTTDFVAGFNSTNLSRLPSGIVFNTIAADADTNGNNQIDRNPDEYAELRAENATLAKVDSLSQTLSRSVIDAVYQIMRNTSTVTVSYRTQGTCPFCRTVATITSVPNSTPLGNDTLVTIPSANGVGSLDSHVTNRMTFTGSSGRNHASVANGGVARTVIPWIISIERTLGDLR